MLPKLIYDLALILILASVVTFIFKRLKQPLVLGYIVAGFLSSPHMPYIPSVVDEEGIHVWSELGVIFLMFSLGLEFSFKKIFRSGPSALFISSLLMVCMILLGAAIGRFMGMSPINYIFLGGMLCISSSTIIYVAFNDLNIMNKRFVGKTVSVFIIEDILGVVLMALLGSMVGGKGGDAREILGIFVQMVFFLLLWFLVGIWLIPTLLRRFKSYFSSKETLLIMSVGLCFLMVVIGSKLGYNAAMGAFIMGSILAETLEAERIEETVSPLKDLFGAIFFVSVGMMVQPALLLEYLPMILILVLAVVLGKMVFGTLSFMLFGCSLPDAVRSSFSLVQIGEFSFIIAQMGVVAGVLDDYIYPVVVMVSVITTFITPYSIKFAVNLKFPAKIDKQEGTKENKVMDSLTLQTAWYGLLKNYAVQTIAYGTLAMAVIRFLFASLLEVTREIFGHWVGNAVCGVLVLALLSLFLRPIVMRKNNSQEAEMIKESDRRNMILFYALFVLRFAVGTAVIYYVVNILSPFNWMLHVGFSIAMMALMCYSKTVKRRSVVMEDMFLYNLRRREEVMAEPGQKLSYARKLSGRDLHVTQVALPSESSWAGQSLAQLHIGSRHGVNVTAVIRDHVRTNIPGGSMVIYPHDVLEVVGDDQGIDQMCARMNSELVDRDNRGTEGMMRIKRMEVAEQSTLQGMPIKKSGIRDHYRCMVIGVEKENGLLSVVGADYIINKGDVIWFAGEHADIMRLQQIMEDEK